jgi:hypothetical protein
MGQTESQNCPLCFNPAEYSAVDRGNRKHFYCSNCTQFQVSRGAENRLAKSSIEWKVGLSKLAKDHLKGSTLVITLPRGPTEDGHRQSRSRARVRGKFKAARLAESELTGNKF